MHGHVHLQPARRDGRAHVEIGAVDAAHSVSSALWEVGLVLAVFLGLALAAGATLAAFGMN